LAARNSFFIERVIVIFLPNGIWTAAAMPG